MSAYAQHLRQRVISVNVAFPALKKLIFFEKKVDLSGMVNEGDWQNFVSKLGLKFGV